MSDALPDAVPRFAAEPPQESLPYGRWAERLREELLRAAADLEDVVVDEAARGHGIGELLNRAALDEARRREIKGVSLTSRPSREAANRLYQRIGFTQRQTNVYRYDF